jgi:general secretion pathway protein H
MAIQRNGETRLLVDVDARTIAMRTSDARSTGLPTSQTVQLPTGMTVTVTAAAADVEPGRVAAIRFFPDGSSTGGRIELRLHERRAVVAVDWLSGRVTRLGTPTLGRAP